MSTSIPEGFLSLYESVRTHFTDIGPESGVYLDAREVRVIVQRHDQAILAIEYNYVDQVLLSVLGVDGVELDGVRDRELIMSVISCFISGRVSIRRRRPRWWRRSQVIGTFQPLDRRPFRLISWSD